MPVSLNKLNAESQTSTSTCWAAAALLALNLAWMQASVANPIDAVEDTPTMLTPMTGYDIEEALMAGKRYIRLDVVELGTKFAFDEAPVDQNGFPASGNPFITQGVIYPPGVVQVKADGTTNGVIVEKDENGNPVARPEFPELVLGLWICRGTVFADEGFNITSGPTVHTDQLFDFHSVGGDFGRISFSTSGLELINVDKSIRRAATGGTGPYRWVRGEMDQTFIGVNASQGFSLRFKTRFR